MEEVGKSVQKPAEGNYCVELMSQLNVLRHQANLCDVTLVVEKIEFKAHRNVLAAASPYFHGMFTSDMQEKLRESVHLKELPVSVMGCVLDYIYTGDVDVNEENAQELVASANYLLLPGLKTLAGEFLAQNVDVSNSIGTYYFAAKYKCDDLLQKSQEFINLNFNAVSKSNGFLALSLDEVKEWLSSDDIIISAEKDAFEAMLRWIRKDESGDRENYFLELFREIRLTSVTRDYLFNDIFKNNFVRSDPKCIDLAHYAMSQIACASGESLPRQKSRTCLEMHVDALVFITGMSTKCYLPSNGCCFELADVLPGQKMQRVTNCRGCLYSVGHDAFGKQSALRYDPLFNSWSPIQEPPQNLKFTAVTALQGFVYLIGGIERSNLQRVGSVCRYDPDINSWQQVTPLSAPKSSVCVVADDKYIYAIGGRIDDEMVDTMERFEPGPNTWMPLASMAEEKSGACGVVLGGNIFVLGGTQDMSGGMPLNTCEVYNCTTNQWQAIPSMQVPRRFAGAAVFGDNIYVFGGVGMDKEMPTTLESYDLQGKEWKIKGDLPSSSITKSQRGCALRLPRQSIENLLSYLDQLLISNVTL